MSQDKNQPNKNRAQYIFNLTLAAVAGQVGFLTLVIVLGALFGGLWLDQQYATKPLFTLILLLASIPLTLVMMFWLVHNATARIKPVTKNPSTQEENDRGTTS